LIQESDNVGNKQELATSDGDIAKRNIPVLKTPAETQAQQNCAVATMVPSAIFEHDKNIATNKNTPVRRGLSSNENETMSRERMSSHASTSEDNATDNDSLTTPTKV